MIKIVKGKIGRDAWKVSKNWRLGFHLFDYIRGGKTFRLVYLRTKKHTHYIDIDYGMKMFTEREAKRR